MTTVQLGVRHNLNQVLQQLLQVLLVGMTVGMMRNVVPALAESEFGVPRGSFLLLVTFVVAFGVVKGGMNFLAGQLAEQHGRQKVFAQDHHVHVTALTTWSVFRRMTWQDPRMMALSQAGLVDGVGCAVWLGDGHALSQLECGCGGFGSPCMAS
jgi:hypothetical protein